MRLLVGDDWAEDHHDVEVMDAAGRVLARRRLPEGVAGMARLHELIGQQLGEAGEDAEVVIGIETDRGPWVAALVAAGYVVYAVNPLQGSRFRERLGVSGAKSDPGDSHMLADMVRTDSHQLRAVAADSAEAGGIKVVARTHKTLIWERTRQVQRLRHQLREYFPAALEAFEDLAAPDALELLGKAPDPARAARLTRAQVSAALKRARRRAIADKTTQIIAALRSQQLAQPAALSAAYAVTVRALAAVITTLNDQVKALESQVEAHFGRHPDAEIYRSQPGMGRILGARVLGEFGDDPDGRGGVRRRGLQAHRRRSPGGRAAGRDRRGYRDWRPRRGVRAAGQAGISPARRPFGEAGAAGRRVRRRAQHRAGSRGGFGPCHRPGRPAASLPHRRGSARDGPDARPGTLNLPVRPRQHGVRGAAA